MNILALKHFARRSMIFVVVWCGIGSFVVGLGVIETLFWKSRGRHISLKSATESVVVRDLSTTRSGHTIAKIIGRRVRDAANPLSMDVVLDSPGISPFTVPLSGFAIPHRVAVSRHNEIALLTSDGRVYIGDPSSEPKCLSERLYRDSWQPTIADLVYSDDGRFLASQNEDGPVVWNTETGLQISNSWSADCSRFLCFFRDSRRILEATSAHVRIRDLLTGQVLREVRTDFTPSAATVSRNGELALLYASGYEVHMWDLTRGSECWRANSRSSRRSHLAIGGSRAYYIATDSHEVIGCDARTGGNKQVASSHVCSVHGLKLLDNTELVSWDLHGALKKSNVDITHGNMFEDE